MALWGGEPFPTSCPTWNLLGEIRESEARRNGCKWKEKERKKEEKEEECRMGKKSLQVDVKAKFYVKSINKTRNTLLAEASIVKWEWNFFSLLFVLTSLIWVIEQKSGNCFNWTALNDACIWSQTVIIDLIGREFLEYKQHYALRSYISTCFCPPERKKEKDIFKLYIYIYIYIYIIYIYIYIYIYERIIYSKCKIE